MTQGEDALRDLIARVAGRDVSALRPQDNLCQVLGLDGLDLIRVVVAAEEVYGVIVDDERLAALHSFGDLLAVFGVGEKKSGQSD